MCGIFGAAEELSDGSLQRVSEALAHRGPDAEGRRRQDGVSLLHRRLKIIDLSDAALQPMSNEDGSVYVVFNGEIYNHHELRRELERLGHVFRSRSDTEAIVHGYEAWGEKLVEKLDGMFAFAVWDRARDRWLLARDRSGKKPLYFSRANGSLRFASTIAALHASGLPRTPNIDALPYYLAYGFVPPPLTFYEGVKQLPPATYMVIDGPGDGRIVEYWRSRFGTALVADSYETASARVRSLLEAAVERRLESDVPLGAFLSGGIDSTIVVGIMARKLGGAVRTFSIGFSGDAAYDETSFARLAAQRFGTQHTEFTVEPSSFELLETLVRHHDGPFGDSSAIPMYVVSKLTRRHVTVALTGDGGDELFCGYLRFLAAEAAERIPKVARLAARRVGAWLPAPHRERSLRARMQRFLDASTMSTADRMARWNSFFFDPNALLRPELSATLNGQTEAPLLWQRAVFDAAEGMSVLARVLEHNFRTYLPYDLLVKADRASMAHGLELRSPFLDTQLVEYAANLPAGYLRRGTTTKRILRHAFRDLLPAEIRRRGKMGFAVPLGSWFRADLKAFLYDHLTTNARILELLDAGAVRALLDAHTSGQADHGQRLWLLLTLEIWLRTFPSASVAA